MTKKNLLLIGPLPDPKGGVSIHIERLGRLVGEFFNIAHVDESRCFKPGVFNIRSINIFKYFALIKKADIVHIHSARLILRIFHVISSRSQRKKTIVTIHGYASANRISAWTDRFFLRFVQKVVVVNQTINDILQLKTSVLIRHGFIPPQLKDEPELADSVKQWIQKQKSLNRKIFTANAWRLDRNQNEDLYGLDLCIELARKLREINAAACFIFNVSSLSKYRDRFEKYRQLIREYGLQDSFLLLNSELSFVKLIQEAHIVLRPTNADGDALTVREALFFNKPVIASDAVARPAGAVLFRSRDIDDLFKKALSVLSHGAAAVDKTAESEDQLSFYRMLYA